MLKLYARANTGSAAVEALLAEVDLPFELAEVPRDESKRPPDWYLSINPRGEVPALGLPDGTAMTESAAMMIYLSDLKPEAGLAPAPADPLRPHFLRWIVYCAANPYTSDLRMYYSDRYSTNTSHADAIKAQAIIDLNRDFDIIARGLGKGPFLLGKTFSAADIYLAMLLSWSEDMQGLFARHKNLGELYARVAARPKTAAVWKRNGMPL